jgi:primary-amine oxidase
VLDQASNRTYDFVVDVVAHRVVKELELDPKTDGQSPVLDQDYWDGDAICMTDPAYVEALAKRGVTDLDMVRGEQFSAGVFGYEGEEGNRMIRVLSFLKVENTHAMYGHPIDGLVARDGLLGTPFVFCTRGKHLGPTTALRRPLPPLAWRARAAV